MPATQPFKAVAAFVLTFVGTLLASLQGRKEFSELTALEWLIVVGSALVTTGAVYGIANPPVARRHRDDLGRIDILGALVIAILAVVLLILVLSVAR